jgi:hypothetical protein
MSKIDELIEQVGACSAGVVALSQRFDGLELRLAATERHCANPAAHQAAHDELRDLCAANGIRELPPKNSFGMFDSKDVDALFAQVRSQPGAQVPDGTCPAHERTIARLATLFRHMGWNA